MKGFKPIAIMLTYPEPWWLDETEALRDALARAHPQAARLLAPFLAELGSADRLWLQERYVETFDRVPDHALYLLQHLPDESARGPGMSALIERYRQHGLEMTSNELPDYLPLFLEYLSLLPPDEARRELAPYDTVIATLRDRLAARRSAYASLFDALALMGAPARASGTFARGLWQRRP